VADSRRHMWNVSFRPSSSKHGVVISPSHRAVIDGVELMHRLPFETLSAFVVRAFEAARAHGFPPIGSPSQNPKRLSGVGVPLAKSCCPSFETRFDEAVLT
jgi:hypothetical protein